MLLTTLLGLLLALAFAARAARQIVGPLERLVEVADAISLGDLTRPVRMERNDEIGDLAQALERMRLSLEAAMDRLRRRKRT
ncbi:HAMP domain-containing protein [Deinococcus sp. PESE-38]